MIAALLGFAARHWKWIALAALFGFLAVQTSRVERLKRDVAEERQAVAKMTRERDGWRKSYEASETIRKAEQADAVSSATEADSACDARVSAARQSARAIERIVTKEVPRDPQGCPVRVSVPADELRDALRPH